jgi:HSP20 family molecular chaperone IbpA
VSVLLPEAESVHLRETADALVVEVDLPAGADASRLAVNVVGGLLSVRIPRVPAGDRIPGFHPDAAGV